MKVHAAQGFRPATVVASAAAAAVVAMLLGGCSTPDADASPGAGIPGTPVEAGPDSCGHGWTGGAAGAQTFAVTNTATTGMAVYLQDTRATPRTYLVLDAIGAGATASASVRLDGGSYRFVCLQADEDPVLGPAVTVTGGKVDQATPSIVLLSQNDLVAATQAYSTWALGRARTLAEQVATLDGDAARGDLGAARADWLTAHTTYGTLGAAYGAFGDLGDAIDGSGTTGFRAVEAQLWGTGGTAGARPLVQGLVTDTTALVKQLQDPRMDPLELGLRSHEILEDVQRETLSGRADGPSGTTLAEVAAAVDGSRAALVQLRPLLAAQGDDLADVDAALDALSAEVATFHHDAPAGQTGWTPWPALTPAQRELLNARLDAALEPLARVAATTEPRRHP